MDVDARLKKTAEELSQMIAVELGHTDVRIAVHPDLGLGWRPTVITTAPEIVQRQQAVEAIADKLRADGFRLVEIGIGLKVRFRKHRTPARFCAGHHRRDLRCRGAPVRYGTETLGSCPCRREYFSMGLAKRSRNRRLAVTVACSVGSLSTAVSVHSVLASKHTAFCRLNDAGAVGSTKSIGALYSAVCEFRL
jgi:hypothetical protein